MEDNFDDVFGSTEPTPIDEAREIVETQRQADQEYETNQEQEKQQVEKWKADCNKWATDFDSGDGPTKVAMMGGAINQELKRQGKEYTRGKAYQEGVDAFCGGREDVKVRLTGSNILMSKVNAKLKGTTGNSRDVANACGKVVGNLPTEQLNYVLYGRKKATKGWDIDENTGNVTTYPDEGTL